ncbi:L-2-hydroxycarboxylate dehydrogenase (NAD+) [Rubritalea squalenifaciens DSM 18772]|uniref:L-2-hydroxycarboxylate dehydrogenase (NAD+) n=2 Tax=Rubritalea squalenifaciens TaxID=407226 RepID=A0A1M6B907_9BACT|nr:L-2-hydroxycarboxylate dehydrogenase (NAD+) [Rubritalea squalenifaciens DSM 18772]
MRPQTNSKHYFFMNVIDVDAHNELVTAAYMARGYDEAESREAADMAAAATWHGNNTHNALKALHLDELFGSHVGGCVPSAEIEVLPSRFAASEVWNSNKKLGQAVAKRAFQRAMDLADEFGVGIVSVDNTFHYLWGGGYVIEAAKKGYIAYTNCTSTLAEVVPFMGKRPTLGTNPHTWGFPTQDILGFPICIDWATSTVAMGRVQQLAREGKELPPNAAVDADGNVTTDPNKVAALLPFGAHKGYGMSLINEFFGALIGTSLPTHRGRTAPTPGEKTSCAFYFQVIHPDALNAGNYAEGRTQMENLKACLDDILDGNEGAMLPGQLEANGAKRSEEAGGLIFTDAELEALNEIAAELGREPLKPINS